MQKILIVEDEPSLRDSIKYNLEKEGYEISEASTGLEAIDAFKRTQPELIILDLMLPELSGEDVCRIIRKESITPIIMLTAKDSELDKIIGLEIGADDYLTKPFNMRELLARVKAILRRSSLQTNKELADKNVQAGHFLIERKQHVIKFKDEKINLTVKEFNLLELFITNPNQVIPRETILRRIWGDDFFGDDKTLDVHIRHIRQKIEKDPSKPEFIKTVRGIGYTFEVNKVEA